MPCLWWLIVACLVARAAAQENNVCPTFEDYRTLRNNSNCWYDLTAQYNAPDTIRLLGYPLQTFKVETRDGHILTMFRIPNHHHPYRKKHPVYLQHGLVATCANFLGLGKDSLAFVLSDAGYDVWLGNYRGNKYSEEHVNLTVRDEKFWDHGMDEVALLDLPAMFHTILTNSDADAQIIYIGHSLGTSFVLMYASEFPEEAQKNIKMCVLMCPAYTLSNMISPYAKVAPFGNFILNTIRDYQAERIVSQAEELERIMKPTCLESPEMMRLCMQLYNLFYGPNADFGPEAVPVYFNQLPGGTSIRILNHAADLVLGNFRKYNFLHRNFEMYGTPEPPVYDITKIHIPIYIIYSGQDWTTPERDALNLYRRLPQQARYGIRKIDMDKFNHIDFVFGRHARQVVFDPLVRTLEKALSN